MTSEESNQAQEVGRGVLNHWQRVGLKAAGCLLAGGAFALPWAATHAITDTEVHDNAGPVPTDIRFVAGRSEFDTGILGKVADPDLTRYGVGASVRLTGPPDVVEQLLSGKTPQLDQSAKQVAHFYGKPSEVKEGYQDILGQKAWENFWQEEKVVGGVLSVILGGAVLSSNLLCNRRDSLKAATSAVALVGITACSLSVLDYMDWRGQNQLSPDAASYPIPSLQGTALQHATADNTLLASLLNHGKEIYDKEVTREQQANQAFLDRAYASIDEQLASGTISLPADNETMFLAISDLHENHDMIQVLQYFVKHLNETAGRSVIAFVTSNGDDAYGEASAKQAIEEEAKIGNGAPMYSVNGNHDTAVTEQQKKDAGIHILKGKTLMAPGDVSVLGNDDPVVTTVQALFGLAQNKPRHPNSGSEAQAGEKLQKTAEQDHPTVLMTHEAYELSPILGISSMTKRTLHDWFAASSALDGLTSDNVPDQPASLETLGHWHEQNTAKRKLFRIVSNSNGTWTDIEELNTAGGANGAEMLTKTSTPWTPPVQPASVVLFTVNNSSQLIVKRQQIDTNTAGEVNMLGALYIGSIDGQPYPVVSDSTKTTTNHQTRLRGNENPTSQQPAKNRRDYR